jgi:hypothetical protein
MLYALGRRSVPPEVHTDIAQRVELGERITPKQLKFYSAPQGLRPPQERQKVNLFPPEAASTTRPNPLTAEDLHAAGRRDLIGLIVDVASRFPRDQSFEEASAVVESIGTEGMRERFSEAVARIHDFVAQLRRILNETQIVDEVPARPSLRVIPRKDD